ncbi:MAG: rod shape-determining protein RodA [Candidatus Ryanbacteria bacterium RIFCSPHIGHO2_01_FULL_48_27]|uniref:Rod shape-determining protein RodA n=1 Tax=Candidatus Ryanbacteria bacterium RIFCSPHIGHO2_01_FULL_48_27 TaxID=1802115 RepID=A0A1G2G7C6_9BACT|nr:MAG: rod shape-determining protein RodA [Candidatus Ryanbacteria bacterium RIFCSPHIGHO2_01_FULL_48_27]
MLTYLKKFDWVLIGALAPMFAWSLLTLKNIGDTGDYFFTRQIVWLLISLLVMFFLASADWRLFSNSGVIVVLYGIMCLLLGVLLLGASRIKGATSWFNFYLASFQPTEIVKLVLILVLAKYFSRRHIDIARFRHIVISGVYAAIPVGLILLQPDLGSSVIVLAIWFGMTLVSGIRPQHLLLLATTGIVIAAIAWVSFLAPYQKDRIKTFLNPTFDPRGAGYNAIQSMIAVGSGDVFGKGVGYGSQSRLKFLPESETDFIFAAFAEEWGVFGILVYFVFMGILLWRILRIGLYAPGNFGKLFAIGFSIMIVFQGAIHIGMNMGMLPITGITLPFMSYGGSSLLMLMAGVGILQSMHIHRYAYGSFAEDPEEGSYI